jgi:Zn finger protein HypA/HybF involved in hydrogenase expression
MDKFFSVMSSPILTPLRCYKCSFEFEQNLTIDDNVSDVICSHCKTPTVELNLGKKVSYIAPKEKMNPSIGS